MIVAQLQWRRRGKQLVGAALLGQDLGQPLGGGLVAGIGAGSQLTPPLTEGCRLAVRRSELGRPDGDPAVREAVELHEEDLPDTSSARERERHRLVVTAARIHGMLDLEPTPDTAALAEAWRAVGAADRLVLTVAQEAAYHRTVDRLNAMATLGDPLVRWAMGTTDH